MPVRSRSRCFEVDQELVGVRADGAQLVELGVVARRDHAAVAQQHGRRLDDRALQQLALRRVVAALRGERLRCARLRKPRSGACSSGSRAQAVAQLRRGRAAARERSAIAREDALEVADRA